MPRYHYVRCIEIGKSYMGKKITVKVQKWSAYLLCIKGYDTYFRKKRSGSRTCKSEK